MYSTILKWKEIDMLSVKYFIHKSKKCSTLLLFPLSYDATKYVRVPPIALKIIVIMVIHQKLLMARALITEVAK